MRKPRLLNNGRFDRAIAIEGVKYTVATSILAAINKVHARDGLPLADGFLVEENGDVIALNGYKARIDAPFSNCFEVQS